MKEMTQLEQIQVLLKKRPEGVTQFDVIRLVDPPCIRLAVHIFTLRKRGWDIVTVECPKKKGPGTYARYILKGEPKND